MFVGSSVSASAVTPAASHAFHQNAVKAEGPVEGTRPDGDGDGDDAIKASSTANVNRANPTGFTGNIIDIFA